MRKHTRNFQHQFYVMADGAVASINPCLIYKVNSDLEMLEFLWILAVQCQR